MKFKAIRDGINAAQENALPLVQDIHQAKIIVFSDHHRGSRDGADDFLPCEKTYQRALNYYLKRGYSLLLLGDVEELWENQPTKTIHEYKEILALEREFFIRNQLFRIWGNHDDLWQFQDKVKQYFGELFPNLKPIEALSLTLEKEGQAIGNILFLHGHQGTLMSAKYADFSKFFVRLLWRPFQRLFSIALNTAAKDPKLRYKTDKAMNFWANMRSRQLIVCGHTHQYIFGSNVSESTKKPCYFNTGCCSYGNGNISGIEISNQKIRLIEWTPEDNEPFYIQTEFLESIFQRCE